MAEKTMEKSKKRILVVDDEIHIRNLLGTYLQKRGFDVKDAGNGREALPMLSTARPDLIILDVLMPLMDGFEFLRELRAATEHAGIPVIILSARSEERYVEKAIALQTDFYLPKPIELDELLKFITMVLN